MIEELYKIPRIKKTKSRSIKDVNFRKSSLDRMFLSNIRRKFQYLPVISKKYAR